MRRRSTLMSTMTVFGLLTAPVASAAQADVGATNPLVSTSSPTTQSTLWSMDPVGDVIHDRSSGPSLRLRGTWARSSGGVRFGNVGTPSMAVSEDRDVLSPGWANFAVFVDLSTNSAPTSRNFSPNVVQKGYSGVGSQWKMQLRPSSEGTKADCRFEGTKGIVVVRDRSGIRLDDSRAHVVGCWRDGGSLGVTVDGHNTIVKRTVGSIKPRTATSVANRKITAGIEDQLRGSVTCVSIAIGPDSKRLALSRSGC